MKVELEKVFPMPVTADVAWAFLQNIEGVAGCVPGAKITGRGENGRYLGTLQVKLGPASLSFKGEIEVRELDAAQRTLRLIGKGSDASGTSGASMDLTARIEAREAGATAEQNTDAQCNLVGKSEVSMSGKAAAFGGRMMGTVADQILKQFAANFTAAASKLTNTAPVASHALAPAPANGSASTIAPLPTIAPSPGAAPSSKAATQPPANDTQPEVSSDHSLNAFALIWAIARDWLRGLFKRKPA